MIKKITIFAILVSFIMFMGGCFGPDHEVRIKNNVGAELRNMWIGTVEFGTVAKGATTSYKSIGTGSHDVTGSYYTTFSTGNTYLIEIDRPVAMLGNGDHSWTVTISDGPSISCLED